MLSPVHNLLSRVTASVWCILFTALVFSLMPSVIPAARAGETFSGTGALHETRRLHTATLLTSGKVLVAGGNTVLGGNNAYLSEAELYDPSVGKWVVTGAMNVARDEFTATRLPDGKVLVVGGFSQAGILSDSELYDPATETWSPTGALGTGRYNHTATLLPNGKVLVAGGYGSPGGFFQALSGAELYDPATGGWTATGSMGTARGSPHPATLLPNGKVLVAGGDGIGAANGTAELYDPALGKWTATGSISEPRSDHTATLLPNGKVLVAGGFVASGTSRGYCLQSAELYDPVSGIWTTTGSLNGARSGHAAFLLVDGEVVVFGGSTNTTIGFDDIGVAELYDPAAGTWTTTGSMITARGSNTATMLANGKVLVAGGWSYRTTGGYLSSAELYGNLRDLNGDITTDLVFQNNTGQVAAWFLDGRGNAVDFSSGTGLKPGSKILYGSGLGDWRVMAWADVNGDGIADLIFQNNAGQAAAWFLDGSGNAVDFSSGTGLKPGSKILYGGGLGDWKVKACADVNSDGIADLIFQNNAGQVAVWFLDGSGNAVDFSSGTGLKPGSKILYGSGLGDWNVR